MLVVDEVIENARKGEEKDAIIDAVQQVPSDLLGLYRELLGGVEQAEKGRSLRLFAWIYFALRPLTLDKLRFAIAIDPDSSATSFPKCDKTTNYKESDETVKRRIKTLSRGLIEIRESLSGEIVQFIHQSVKDFLIQDGFQVLDANLKSADETTGRIHLRLC